MLSTNKRASLDSASAGPASVANSASAMSNDLYEASDNVEQHEAEDDTITLRPDKGKSRSSQRADSSAKALSGIEQCDCYDCEKAAAVSKKPRSHHSINCWQSDCKECKNRAPGVECWDPQQTARCKNPFVAKSHMVQTYAEGRNIIAILPSKEMFRLMRLSAKARRRLLDFKFEEDPKIEESSKETHSLMSKMREIQERLKGIASEINKQGGNPQPVLLARQSDWRVEYDGYLVQYAHHRESMKASWTKLKAQEALWKSHMRRLGDAQDALLVDCGILEDLEDVSWESVDYSVGHLDPEQDIYDGWGRNMHQRRQSSAVQEEDSVPEHGKLMENLGVAIQAQDAHRDDYSVLLEEFSAENELHPDAGKNELATKFAPVYMAKRYEIHENLKKAEDAAEQFEQDAWERGVAPMIIGDHADPKNQEEAIEEEGLLSMQEYNHEKVDRWRSGEKDAISIAHTIDDNLEELVTEDDTSHQDVQDSMGENAQSVKEPESAAKKPSAKAPGKRKATEDAAPSTNKRPRTDKAATQQEDEPVIFTEHRYNLRKRKEPTAPATKAPARRKKGTEPKKRDEAQNNPPPTAAASSSKRKLENNIDTSIPSSSIKRKRTDTSPPLQHHKRPRTQGTSNIQDLATIDVPRPTAISAPLRVGEYAANEVADGTKDPLVRWRIDVWARRVRGGWL
jgi:hypothetical protein